jgi:pyruvate formate lyase activating enzyme
VKIGGLQKFSILDYPGKVSCIVFCRGCLLKCHYCHNKNLQNFSGLEEITEDELMNFLANRKGLLDAVVFSGGEPLCQQDLYHFMFHMKHSNGFLIGLHTSGCIYEQFLKVLDVVDWIGFDIKTEFEDYEKITQVPNSGDQALKSFLALVGSKANFEVRTTYDPRFITDNNMINVAKFLANNNVERWIIQECILRNNGKTNEKLSLPNKNLITKLNKIINIEIRK